MQYGFYFDQTRCTGCFACAVACKDWHDIPAGPVAWRSVTAFEKGKYPHPFLAYLSESCYHCARPACVEACPAGAIIKEAETGIVIVDRDACLGRSVCGGPCGDVCPYGAPQYAESGSDTMQKCDFCLERVHAGSLPVCVESCPLRALDAGSLDDLQEKYGLSREAAGFDDSRELQPSVLLRPKKA